MGTQSSLTADGQVTIPRDVLEALDLKPGQTIEIEREGDHIVLRVAALPTARWEDLTQDERLARIDLASQLATPLDMTVDEYMAMIREPVPIPYQA